MLPYCYRDITTVISVFLMKYMTKKLSFEMHTVATSVRSLLNDLTEKQFITTYDIIQKQTPDAINVISFLSLFDKNNN